MLMVPSCERVFVSSLAPDLMVVAENPEFRGAITLAARSALLKKAAKRGDILAWGQAAMPEKFTLPFCADLHDYMVKIRTNPLSGLKAPRGFAKTVIGCNLVPMYQALEEPNRFNYYLNVQSNDEKAMAVNRAIKFELEDNEVLRHVYGDQISSRWTDQEFLLNNGVVFRSAGAGVSLRGLQFRNRRPDYVIVDDLYDEEDIFNQTSTVKKNNWLKGTLYKVLTKSKPSVFHVQGTAINPQDILTDMEKWPGCVNRTFQAEKDGVSLWPELYSMKELMADREIMGTLIYNREMMNVCQDDSEAIVKSTYLKDWEYDPEVRWARSGRDFRVDIVLLGCDPSTGEKEVGDPAGFAVVVKTSGPGTRVDYWIEALHNEVLSWDERLAMLERMQSYQNAKGPEFHIRRAFIEAIGGFKDFANQAKAKTSLPVDVISWVKGKKANLASKSGLFEFGKVHISKSIKKETRDELESQLTQNAPKHDDLRDAVLLCLEAPNRSMKDWV